MGLPSTAEARPGAGLRPRIQVLRASTARRGQQARPVPGRRAAPSRLTRRGRVVVAVLAVLVTAGLAVLAWLALAGGARASGRGQSGPAGYRQAMTRVVVRPGQTLWGIAVKAAPAADPRLVIRRIIDINSLPGAGIEVGQVLWVPRG